MNCKAIVDLLLQKAEELRESGEEFLVFSGLPEYDQLIYDLENYIHAFVIACIMDRQVITDMI